MEKVIDKTTLHTCPDWTAIGERIDIQMHKEKALIITPFYAPNIGGCETFAEDLAKALSKKYIVHVCTIKWTKPVLWSGLPYSKAVQMFFRLYASLLNMKRKNKYERVFALGLVSSAVCVFAKVKFDSVILALYDLKKKNRTFRRILNCSNKVFVEGNAGEQEMVTAGVKKHKIVKFTHWVDQTRFRYTPKNNVNMRVLFVGRPIPIKGKHIIQACEQMTKDIDYEYIENCPYEDLPKHYQMADVVVVPSLYSEGFSRVVVEAASCGCALLTSNKGSLPELVQGFGQVVEPTPARFAETLIRLKKNRPALEKIQINTFAYSLKHFSLENADCFLL